MKFHSIKPLRLALAALICTASAVSLAQQTTENTAESSEPNAEEPGETAPAAPAAPVVAQGPQLLEQAPAVLPDGTTFPSPASPRLHEHGHPDGWYGWRGHDYTRGWGALRFGRGGCT